MTLRLTERALGHVRACSRLSAVVLWTVWQIVRRSPSAPGWATQWAAGVCRCLGLQVLTWGPLPQPGSLVVANHLGYVDILAMLSQCPLTFVAKHEIAQWPVAGRLARTAGLIFINRSRLRDVHRVKGAMIEALATGQTVAYFPEATSSDGRTVLPFRSGLFSTAVESATPVTTAAIAAWTSSVDATPHDRLCWHGDAALLPHLYRLAMTPEHGVAIRFGRVADQTGDRKALAAIARESIIRDRPAPVPAPCYHPRFPWSKGGLRWSR